MQHDCLGPDLCRCCQLESDLARAQAQRTEAERARLDCEQKYRQLFEEALDIVFTLDLEGNFTSVNKAGQRISGYTRNEILAMNLAGLVEPECLPSIKEKIQRALGGETIPPFELAVLTRDGRHALVEVSARLQFENGRPALIQGIARDITERKRLEEQLRHRQKMEAIGELASGVAHDFNNLLSAILGYADLLKAQSKPGDTTREAAEVIVKAGERAQQLTRRLLGFTPRGDGQNVAVDLHAVLREVAALLKPTFPKHIEIATRLEAESPVVLGDPDQMHQVFLNLALNARDAMPQGGMLTFQTEASELNEQSAARLGATSPGSYLRVSVTDTGVGIPSEHQPRIFEPFFTTKERGKGAGIGLSVVYGIVKNHGGAIEVLSQPGQGTAFRIYLPFHADTPIAAAPARAANRLRGAGRVLVIDDEEIVCRVTTSMLESLGYQVVWIPDPRQAVEVYRKASAAFDLVIVDMIMPGLGGIACFRALREINPTVKAILSSGFAQDAAVEQALQAGMLAVLPKPYQCEQLAEVVSAALPSRERERAVTTSTPESSRSSL